MTTSGWLINNQPLETLARYLSAAEGLQQTPEPREFDVVVPGMDGDLDVGSDPTSPRRSAGPGRITFSGLLQGVDPDTGQLLGGSDSWAVYLQRVDELIRLFSPRQLVIDHVRPDGTRRAVGWRQGSIAPSRERTSPVLGRWSVTVKIPSGFWAGLQDVTIGGSFASGQQIPLGGLGVGTAPITDALVTFGPGSNPTLVQGGTFLAYDGVIAGGRELAVETDPANPGVGPGAGALWTPVDSAIRYGPSARWCDLDPLAGPLTLNHTGGGQMSVQITARPKYQTS